jgi:hypothetical protein
MSGQEEDMPAYQGLEIIHILWNGPKTAEEAIAADTGNGYGVYQIYGTHDVSGPDTLLYIGQADAGPFANRIAYHHQEWGRWNPDEVTIYLERLAGLEAITNEEWGTRIDRAEAALIWKIGLPFNSARIKTLKYRDKPILIVNHGRRHRLPECICTITEFVNTDHERFKQFGSSGDPVAAPVPQPRDPSDEE